MLFLFSLKNMYLFLSSFLFLIYGYFACMYVYVPTTWVSGLWSHQKSAFDPLDLELQIFVSHQMSAKNQTQVLWKNSNCPWLMNCLSSLWECLSNQERM